MTGGPRFVLLTQRNLKILFLGVAPVLLLLSVLVVANDFGFDLRQFWQGGRDVLNGVSPYPDAATLHAATGDRGPSAIPKVFRFPYPAGSALAMVPFALLPFHAAAVVLAVLSIGSVLLALWLLGVRDLRCYGITFASTCVISAVRFGTLTPIVLLAFALAWRHRNRPWVAGAAIAGAVVLKIFPWPAIVWLAVTRRFRAAAIAASLAVATTFAAWAVIGFAGLGDYALLLRRLAAVDDHHGYSLVALGSAVGLGEGASRLLPWVAGALALLAALLLARGPDGDRRAFALAVVASILFTPVVWLHYFVLLYPPIAVWRRSLSVAWLLPLLFVLTPARWHVHQSPDWHVGLGLAIALATLAAAVPRPSAVRLRRA